MLSHELDLSIFQEMSVLSKQLGAVNLSQGIPESINNKQINQAVAKLLESDWQYTQPEGLFELRQAVQKDHHDIFSAEKEILVTSGCTESLFVALSVANRLDYQNLIYLEPYYAYYPEMAQSIGLQVKPVPFIYSKGKFYLDFKRLEVAFASGKNVLLLNTPHNPTGWVLNEEDADRLEALVIKYNIFIIFDDVYKDFVYESQGGKAFYCRAEIRNRSLVAGSVSKGLSATGMRVGWLMGRELFVAMALRVHMYMSYCLPELLQSVAARLLDAKSESKSKELRLHYQSKRDILLHALQDYGFSCAVPSGGHFILAEYGSIAPQESSALFARFFAKTCGIVPLPVESFFHHAAPKMLRFSFAVSMSEVKEASFRLRKAKKTNKRVCYDI